MYIGPHGNLTIRIGSCEGVELTLLSGTAICLKDQQMHQCHLLNLIAPTHYY